MTKRTPIFPIVVAERDGRLLMRTALRTNAPSQPQTHSDVWDDHMVSAYSGQIDGRFLEYIDPRRQFIDAWRQCPVCRGTSCKLSTH